MRMTSRFQFAVIALSVVLLIGIGCASHNRSRVIQKTEQVDATRTGDLGVAPMNPKEQAQSIPERHIVAAVEFAPGRKGLSPEATAELNRVLMEAKQSGDVDEVNIAVWSDVEASAGQGQKIPKAQVQLAQDRAQNIERYIDRMEPRAEVNVHNVASETSSFVDFLQSQDRSVKNRMASMGVAANEATDELKGRSSSALILIKLR